MEKSNSQTFKGRRSFDRTFKQEAVSRIPERFWGLFKTNIFPFLLGFVLFLFPYVICKPLSKFLIGLHLVSINLILNELIRFLSILMGCIYAAVLYVYCVEGVVPSERKRFDDLQDWEIQEQDTHSSL